MYKADQISPEKLKMVAKTRFPRIVWGPSGCYLLSLLVPKSKFRGSKKSFLEMSSDIENPATLPPEYFPPSARPESSPGADLVT